MSVTLMDSKSINLQSILQFLTYHHKHRYKGAFYFVNMNLKITLIVLNWNRSQDTINCLKSLENLKDDNYEILLVDNKSRLDPIENILIEFPNINLLKLDENYGYSGGNNRGFGSLPIDSNFVCFLKIVY